MATVTAEAVQGSTAGSEATSPPPVTKPGRLVSLDIFRGITIAGMLLVNNPGSWSAIYPPLGHAKWHGWTPTDLIFPFFLFIVGVALVYSFSGHAQYDGATRNALMRKAAKRAAILFLLGLILQGFPKYDLSIIRIPGVLQRIAICFFFTAAAVLYTRTKLQVAILAALLLGYWALQTLVPAPGVWPGALLPGTDLGSYIDRAVYTSAHLWQSAKTWDPEGLLSTLPAIGTALTGVFAGKWLRTDRTQLEKVVGLFVAGWAGVLAGWFWSPLFPINKSLWTSSYVLFTSGMACHFLALCYWTADVKGWRAWGKPFQVFGMNAIAAFWLSGLMARLLNIIKLDDVALKTVIYDNAYKPFFSPLNASLAFALSYVLLWLGLMWLLYWKKIFIKV